MIEGMKEFGLKVRELKYNLLKQFIDSKATLIQRAFKAYQ